MSNLLKLKKSDKPGVKAVQAEPWNILVVDDDPEVFAVSSMILSHINFMGRDVRLLKAESAAQAKQVMAEHDDIAVVLLDVVMETDDAGLMLVKYIREDVKNYTIRIILRTGQPGQAPEEKVIVDYDINDYKSKSELTAQKLFTTVVAALRSYKHIKALEANRIGLERVINSSDGLFRMHSMREFSSGVLSQLSAYLGHEPEGILCFQNKTDDKQSMCDMGVIAAAGGFEECLKCELGVNCSHKSESDLVKQAFKARESIYGERETALYIGGSAEHINATVALVRSSEKVDEIDRRILEVFSKKIGLGFHNVSLLESLEQKVEERTNELHEANQKLTELACTDLLTGQRTRHAFFDQAEKEIQRAKRYGSDLAFMFFDIDSFKQVNDEFGHIAGDDALAALGRVLTTVFRANDVVGRVGGDEFVALLPSSSSEEAVKVAERIRSQAAAIQFKHKDMKISLSIGVTGFSDGDSVEHLISRADEAMYSAKEQGKNKVVTI